MWPAVISSIWFSIVIKNPDVPAQAGSGLRLTIRPLLFLPGTNCQQVQHTFPGAKSLPTLRWNPGEFRQTLRLILALMTYQLKFLSAVENRCEFRKQKSDRVLTGILCFPHAARCQLTRPILFPLYVCRWESRCRLLCFKRPAQDCWWGNIQNTVLPTTLREADICVLATMR